MPQEKPVYKNGQIDGYRKSQLVTSASQTRDLTYAEKQEAKAAEQAASDKQAMRDRSMGTSPEVRRALAAATGFVGHSR